MAYGFVIAFKPEPGPEEAATATLIKNVTKAGST